MSNYSSLKTAIQQAVYTNGNNEITGAGLQSVLLQIVDTVGDGYVFKGVATAGTTPGTPDANVFYIAPPGTYTNFGGSYTVPLGSIGVFAWNGDQYILTIVKTQDVEVFDISAYNNNAKYADLADALNGGNNIPQSVQKGGISVKFIQSSDNKYVQYRLMSDSWSTVVANWQGVDETPTYESNNLVKSGSVYKNMASDNLHDAVILPTELYPSDKVIKTQLFGVVENGQTGKYVRPSDNTVQNAGGYFVSAPIHLYNGQTIEFLAKASQTVVLSKYSNGTYEPLIVEYTNTEIRRYSYRATLEMDVCISGASSNLKNVLVFEDNPNSHFDDNISEDDTVVEVTDFSILTNAYISVDGTTISASNYVITEPFQVAQGDIIIYKGVFGYDACPLARNNSGTLTPLVAFEGQTGFNASQYQFMFLVSEDMEVVLCSRTDAKFRYGVVHKEATDFPFPYIKGKKMNDAFENKVETFSFVIALDYGIDYYVNNSGTKAAYVGYVISTPLPLNEGDVIEVKDIRCNGGAAISLYEEDGQGSVTFTPVVAGTGKKTYTYNANTQCSVVLCGDKETTNVCQITITRNSYGTVVEKSKLDQLSIVQAFVPVDIFINTTYGDGHYVGHNGAVGDQSTYFISDPIDVLAGQVFHVSGLEGSGCAAIALYMEDGQGNVTFKELCIAISTINEYTIELSENCKIVCCGTKASLPVSAGFLEPVQSRVATMKDLENLKIEMNVPSIENPYSGMDFSRNTLAQTHEHCYDESEVTSAYNRGIRVIACSHYLPAAPRYPLSDFDWNYQDYKSVEAVNLGDTELVTRNISGSIPTITVDGQTIDTDTIPQIANAEHPFVKNQREHFNILGLLWAEPGYMLANGESSTVEWKREHALVTAAMLNNLLEDESKWQFGSQYVFGTINHTYNLAWLRNALEACPNIFKAMEIFNQGYSAGWNQRFKDAYDTLLREGKRLWCTSVVDWQGDWARWDYITPEEQAEWTQRFNALSQSEQQEYGTAENYYMQTGRFTFDRGANRILLPENYDSLSVSNKAKEIVKAYIGGRYYLVGLGNYSINISTDGFDVTFRFSDICPSVKVIDGKTTTVYQNKDTVHYHISSDSIYVRIEADWNDGDFVYTNPIFINND